MRFSSALTLALALTGYCITAAHCHASSTCSDTVHTFPGTSPSLQKESGQWQKRAGDDPYSHSVNQGESSGEQSVNQPGSHSHSQTPTSQTNSYPYHTSIRQAKLNEGREAQEQAHLFFAKKDKNNRKAENYANIAAHFYSKKKRKRIPEQQQELEGSEVKSVIRNLMTQTEKRNTIAEKLLSDHLLEDPTYKDGVFAQELMNKLEKYKIRFERLNAKEPYELQLESGHYEKKANNYYIMAMNKLSLAEQLQNIARAQIWDTLPYHREIHKGTANSFIPLVSSEADSHTPEGYIKSRPHRHVQEGGASSFHEVK